MKPRKIVITGATIFIIGIMFGFLEIAYFIFKDGWHVLPCNHKEALCDFITYSVVSIGGSLMIWGIGKEINAIEVD